jgi:hypothetical protein
MVSLEVIWSVWWENRCFFLGGRCHGYYSVTGYVSIRGLLSRVVCSLWVLVCHLLGM